MAMMAGSEEVTLLSMSGKWEGEASTEAFEFCVDGAHGPRPAVGEGSCLDIGGSD